MHDAMQTDPVTEIVLLMAFLLNGLSQKIVRQKSIFRKNPYIFMEIRQFGRNFHQFCKLLCTHLVKTFNFYNMLLAAKYAPRKNLENTHIRQIRANKCWNFVQNGRTTV